MADENRVSQVVVEVANSGTEAERVSQVVIEVANRGTEAQRVSQVVIELATKLVAVQRVSQLVVEVARSPKITTFPIDGRFSGSDRYRPSQGAGTLTVVR